MGLKSPLALHLLTIFCEVTHVGKLLWKLCLIKYGSNKDSSVSSGVPLIPQQRATTLILGIPQHLIMKAQKINLKVLCGAVILGYPAKKKLNCSRN